MTITLVSMFCNRGKTAHFHLAVVKNPLTAEEQLKLCQAYECVPGTPDTFARFGGDSTLYFQELEVLEDPNRLYPVFDGATAKDDQKSRK